MNDNIKQAWIQVGQMEITPDTKIGEMINEFHRICRGNNIKQGSPILDTDGNQVGRVVNTTEWTIIQTALIMKIRDYFMFYDLLNEAPEDLKQ